MGWTGIRNGKLLAVASDAFDVLITVDRNLGFQQNVATSGVAIVVLHARTNRLADLRPLVPQLLAMLPGCRSGELRMSPIKSESGSPADLGRNVPVYAARSLRRAAGGSLSRTWPRPSAFAS